MNHTKIETLEHVCTVPYLERRPEQDIFHAKRELLEIRLDSPHYELVGQLAGMPWSMWAGENIGPITKMKKSMDRRVYETEVRFRYERDQGLLARSCTLGVLMILLTIRRVGIRREMELMCALRD